MPGTLYLCATPIGNMGDITERVVKRLGTVDIIAAEDTRNSRKILSRYDIHVPMISYHQHNQTEKGRMLADELLAGKDVALISDAGMPGISDPGRELVNLCIEEGIEFTVLPGASACITALVISGMDSRSFCFEGFLPREKEDKKGRRAVLKRLERESRTTIFYEAPHRLTKTLEALAYAAGEERKVAMCHELTKKHESVFRGSLAEAIEFCKKESPRGEYVLVLEGADSRALLEEEQRSWQDIPLQEHLQLYLDQEMEKKEAMKRVASDRGLSRRQVYSALLDSEP